MLPTYGNIPLAAGHRSYGISAVYLTPKEWIVPWLINPNSNTIQKNISLTVDSYWMQLSFAPQSHTYEENSKANKGGTYYDIKFTGLISHVSPAIETIFETLRYKECVCVFQDMNHQQRVVGDSYAAMAFTIDSKTANSGGGTKNILLTYP